jgi:hypothetical protein
MKLAGRSTVVGEIVQAMESRVLQAIATAPFDAKVTIAAVQATYFGSTLPFHGVATVTGDRAHIVAEMDDPEGWNHEVLRQAPGWSEVTGALFRVFSPGKLIGDAGRGRIVPDAGPLDARDVINTGHTFGFKRGKGRTATFGFRIGEFVEHGPAYGHVVTAQRHIFAGGSWNHVTEFFDRPVAVRFLTPDATSIDDETLAIIIVGELDDIDAEALWLWASFISGNIIAPMAIESYASDGRLVARSRRPGRPGTERHEYFRPAFAPFSPDGMHAMLEGLSHSIRSGFPINVVMAHLFESATGDVDFDGIHLTLSYHTAIEAWNRLHGAEYFTHESSQCPMDDKTWEKVTRPIRRSDSAKEFFRHVGDALASSVRAKLAHANRTTTAWRQRKLFDDLGIDVSGEDMKRILDMRDELLHNGYLLKRWSQLTESERQRRYDDIGRLRRLALFVLFRLTGYEGPFQDPLSYQPITIPPRSQGPVQP